MALTLVLLLLLPVAEDTDAAAGVGPADAPWLLAAEPGGPCGRFAAEPGHLRLQGFTLCQLAAIEAAPDGLSRCSLQQCLVHDVPLAPISQVLLQGETHKHLATSIEMPQKRRTAAQAAEDSEWAAAGEGAKSKAQAKKDAQAKEREQAAAKKAEAKKLAAQEEAELAATAKKANKKAAAPATKVTAFERQKQQEADQKQQAAEAAKAAKDKQRMVDEESYEAQVAVENPNRAVAAADAHTVEEALSVLGVQEEEDKHPEK
eukprot:jgi/Astpho2/7032/fgenesh1_pg.00107_%23_72_t